jgi:hypothetical protein
LANVKKGLGRGLDALFESYKEEAGQESIGHTSVQEIAVTSIDPNPNQARSKFDDEKIKELADSIRIHGVVQPIIVTTKGKRYQIVAGERRWRASRLANKDTIPAIVVEIDEKQSIEIGPYLDDPQQDALYTAAGVMETIQMVKDVMNHTYQNQQRATIMNVPPNPRVRKVEAIKAIRPYIPPDNRKQLNQVLNFYEGADKVHRNFKAFQNSQILKEGQKTSLLELVTDILNVIHPVLPQEQRDQAEKASQIIKMIEVMGAVNKGSKKERRQHAQKAEDEKSKAKKIKEENPSDSSEQINKIMDSFAPMLNDEQKESMNMIMKMAQLLSQPDQGTNTDPDGN